jgi:transcriptional regulator with XRE-family HTH domain
LDVALCYNRKQKGGDNMVNTLKLRGRIRERGLTQKDVAIMLGVSETTVGAKINNRSPITLDEAERISEVLGISDDEFVAFFLDKPVA